MRILRIMTISKNFSCGFKQNNKYEQEQGGVEDGEVQAKSLVFAYKAEYRLIYDASKAAEAGHCRSYDSRAVGDVVYCN